MPFDPNPQPVTQAILVADRLGAELAPLSGSTCVGLLPVAAKPMLVHALEALFRVGVRDITLLVSPFADDVQRRLGDGARWGLRIEYVLTRGEEPPAAVLGRLRQSARDPDRPLLALRGDVVQGFDLGAWLYAAMATPGEAVWASALGRSAGCGLLRGGLTDLAPLHWPLPAAADGSGRTWVTVAANAHNPVMTLAHFHRANLDAVAGRAPGLVLPGRETALGLRIGLRSEVSPRSLRRGVALVGERCRIAADAVLAGEVAISDDVLIDRRAIIRSSVVLPHTYVGMMVEARNAILCGNTLIRVDTGTVLQITDVCLLANLKDATVRAGLAPVMHWLLGLVVLGLSLPLWPVAALAARHHSRQGDRGPLLRTLLLRGNRLRAGAADRPQRRNFRAWTWHTPIPVLRHLPWLLAVVSGDLRMVGVTPLTPDETDALVEDWERARERAPVGLLGPTQLTVPADAPREERLMGDAFYARQHSNRGDLVYVARGLRTLFSARAWRAPTPGKQ